MDKRSFDEVSKLAQGLNAEDRRKLMAELSASSPELTAGAILQTLAEHAATLRAMGVAKIGLFGSYARGEARLDSDIDLLVEMSDPGYSYLDLFGVEDYLQNLFTPKIDLAPEDGLKPRIRPAILSEVMYAEGL